MPKTAKTLRKRRLKDLNDCARAAAWLWNELARQQIEPAIAGRLSYLLNVSKSIFVAIESLELEKKQLNEFSERLSKIEKKLGITN